MPSLRVFALSMPNLFSNHSRLVNTSFLSVSPFPIPGKVSILTSSSVRCRYAKLYLSSIARPGRGPTRWRQECSKPPVSIESPRAILQSAFFFARPPERSSHIKLHRGIESCKLKMRGKCIPSPMLTTAQLGFDITNAHCLLRGANTCRPGDPVKSIVKDPRSVCGVWGSPVSEAG